MTYLPLSITAPVELTAPDSRHCTKCAGLTRRPGYYWIKENGERYTAPETTCHYCNGSGQFPALDIAGIADEIKGRKGLRSTRPKSTRAYYVWRMARFHGGADVTMPVCATMDIAGDPFTKELDILADAVARKVHGSDMRAALRWGRALGHDIPRNAHDSDSTQSCGPVLSFGAVKPECELAELV